MLRKGLTQVTPPILILSFRRPILLRGAVHEARLARPDSPIFVSVDRLPPNLDRRVEEENRAAVAEAHRLSVEMPLTSLLRPPAARGIISHAIWAVNAVHLITGATDFILLEDDHRLTPEGFEFLERALRESDPHLPVLACAYSSRVHLNIPTCVPRRTSFPELWGLGINLRIVNIAEALRARPLSPWSLRVVRPQGTSLFSLKPLLSRIHLSRTLNIAVRSANHFDALLLAAALSSGQLTSTPSRPELTDLGGGGDSYSQRSAHQEPTLCEASVYGPDGVCTQCESVSQSTQSRQLICTAGRKVSSIFRLAGWQTPGL